VLAGPAEAAAGLAATAAAAGVVLNEAAAAAAAAEAGAAAMVGVVNRHSPVRSVPAAAQAARRIRLFLAAPAA